MHQTSFPLYRGGCASVRDPEPSKERVGDWGGPATVWSLLCAAETRATRPNGEWGYSTRRQCWAMRAQRRCHPEEALYLPTFSHLFDCQLTSLSLSLSLSLSHTHIGPCMRPRRPVNQTSKASGRQYESSLVKAPTLTSKSPLSLRPPPCTHRGGGCVLLH